MLAVNQIRKLRGASEFGDVSVRPRITTKPKLSANSLTNFISWHPEQVYELDFTCHMADVRHQVFVDKPYMSPKFCSYRQSTESCVKLVTGAASELCGQEARDGYTPARVQHKEAMSLSISLPGR